MNGVSGLITAAVIRQARELISDPVRWTKVFYARTAEDHGCDPLSSDAYRWCLLGAILKVARQTDDVALLAVAPIHNAARAAGLLPSGQTIFDINDNNDHAAVIAYMDRLADALERQEAGNA